MRYNTAGPDGETRADRNDRFGVESPDLDADIPKVAEYLWQWFHEINKSRQTGHEGMPQKTLYEEIKAWGELTNNKLTPKELDIIMRIDEAYCESLTEEITYIRKIEAEKARRK